MACGPRRRIWFCAFLSRRRPNLNCLRTLALALSAGPACMKPCLKTQPAAFKILREPDRLMIRFRTPHRALSWAVAGGGFRITQTVIWYRVHNGKSCIGDLSGYLEEKMKSEKLQTPVVLLTSADLAAYCDCTSAAGKIAARCITTVGLHNALRVGDPPGKPIRGAGTINLLCRISVPLSNEALIETVSVAEIG